jgi:hypothetical protein
VRQAIRATEGVVNAGTIDAKHGGYVTRQSGIWIHHDDSGTSRKVGRDQIPYEQVSHGYRESHQDNFFGFANCPGSRLPLDPQGAFS